MFFSKSNVAAICYFCLFIFCVRMVYAGFSSLFLYRRLYRCYTTLNNFSFDDGNVERRKGISFEEFSSDYDGKKPVLI